MDRTFAQKLLSRLVNLLSGPIATFGQAGFKTLDKFRQRYSEHTAHFTQLKDIKPTFTRLILTYERLCTTKTICEITLSQTRA